jgi:aspartate 1-decarboxylase
MQRQMLKSKIHRATITDCDLHYAGSITIDSDLMRAADLLPNELVHVLDIDNGERFETYVIEGRPGSGDVQVNGAAARLVQRGDLVIIVSYALFDEDELREHRPRVVHVDAHNSVVRVDADASAVV